jgi:hypothetical protein
VEDILNIILVKNPHIIRKNRHSIAVLNGNESEEELYQLGLDVFEYFGLGCRNVSMIWIPKDYKYETLLKAWKPFEKLMMFHSYKNNSRLSTNNLFHEWNYYCRL